jgi:hypothetical protein
MEVKLKKTLSCAWHGCEKCFNQTAILPTGRTAREERMRCELRAEAIQQLGLDLHTVWTCEIQEMLDADPEMSQFFNNCFDMGPISMRDAYFGGQHSFFNFINYKLFLQKLFNNNYLKGGRPL